MAESGTRARTGEGPPKSARVRWSGLALTTVLLVALTILGRTPFQVSEPELLCAAAIVYASFIGGFTPGLLSCVLAVAYLALFYSFPGAPLHYSFDHLRTMLVVGATLPAIALMVGLLKQGDLRRERTEAQAQALKGFHDLVHGLDAILWEADARTWQFHFVNSRAAEVLGYPLERWRDEPGFWVRMLHPDDREDAIAQCREAVERGRDHVLEYRVLAADGRVVWLRHQVSVIVDDSGPIRLRGVMLDITEQKRAEESLRREEERFRQSQKMDAIGRLAGGVAHDFNNLLTVILGHSEQLLGEYRAPDSKRTSVMEIQRAAERAADLTRQLLAFSRRQVLEPVVLDLNAVTEDMHSLLSPLIGEHIELRTMRGVNLGRVRADRSQIEQVIVNLAINARDAMPDGGRLMIETRNAELDTTNSHGAIQVAPGRYVLLAVSDTGSGIDPEVASRIFEPFFTTKEISKGTGLGLATVYGIVKQSGGYIWVYSERGRGTTFKIYLPRVDEVVEPEAQAKPGAGEGDESVMLVEDDAEVRALLSGVLSRRGYHLLVAEDGAHAIALSERHAGPIHLLVTDVVMPRMSGRELAERLCARRPDMRVLYVSGYTDDAIVHHGVLDAGVAFLQKPFAPEALSRKVREVLDAPVRV